MPNFQDAIKDVWDPATHSFKTTGSAAATIFAVVNTSAAGQASVVLDNSINRIGFATVSISTPTLFAVVNTAAAGQASVVIDAGTKQIGSVTVSNPITLNSVVTLSPSVNAIGFTTVFQASSARTITGNITLSDPKAGIGLVSVFGGSLGLNAGVNNIGFASVTPVAAWPDPKTFIGLVTVAGGSLGNTGNVTLNAGPNHIGSVTIFGTISSSPGMTTIFPGPNFIGLTTTVIGNALVTVTLGTRINSVDDSISVGQYYPALQSLASGSSGTLAVDVNQRQLLGDPKGYIGLVTITGSLSAAAGNVTLDPGSKTQIVGNITLSDSKTYIGLVTATVGNNPVLGSGVNNIGFATVFQASSARTITGNITLSDAKTFIGLTSVKGNIQLIDSLGAQRELSVGLPLNITGDALHGGGDTDGSTYGAPLKIGGRVKPIGTLVSVASGLRTNAWFDNEGRLGTFGKVDGTTKTLIPISIAFSTTSVSTIAVPTGGTAIFSITQLLINANATVRVSIKSGATYLTGNASIGINLNPGGGWVENGSTNSPIYIGLASGAAIVFEKNDITTAVGGKIIYFQE